MIGTGSAIFSFTDGKVLPDVTTTVSSGGAELNALKVGGGSLKKAKKTCVKKTQKKYVSRKYPPFSAATCKNQKKLGNDRKYYVSKKVGAVYRWVPFAKK